ncbi:MAG: hypothetical protein O6945_06205 [Gammaproteobacteria bacterium]|nr:hypothetical protein [Gammaproteobacteria bacterium]
MSKYIYIIKDWFRPNFRAVARDLGIPAADINLPPMLDTFNQHRDKSTAQILAGTGIMH